MLLLPSMRFRKQALRKGNFDQEKINLFILGGEEATLEHLKSCHFLREIFPYKAAFITVLTQPALKHPTLDMTKVRSYLLSRLIMWTTKIT